MSDLPAHARARLLFDPAELAYDFGPLHPMQPLRLEALRDLLETSGLWRSTAQLTRLSGRLATLEELQLVHSAKYIAAVQRLSQPAEPDQTEVKQQEQAQFAVDYGFDNSDTPAFPAMHDLAARITGSTLVALCAVMGLPEGGAFTAEAERPLHVFHPAGGWHHAWAERASGFCIYNDIAVAIAHVLNVTESKVLFLDFDAHHGDGVQRVFYDDSRVMTISLHETGRSLFPGTGDVLEMGNGAGRGYAVNVPLEAFTEDDSYIEALDALLAPLVASFAPDVILSMHGCDVHAWDPLTHLCLTMRGLQVQAKAAHDLAHAYCNGRWVALGGGGYDPYRVVPRAWSLLWAEMSEQPIPEPLPEAWIARWRPAWEATQAQEELSLQIMRKPSTGASFPTTFQDRAEDFPAQPQRLSISITNQRTVALVRHLLVSSPMRHAFPALRRQSPLTDIFERLRRQRSDTPSRTKVLETKQGTLLLRDFCPPSLIERLRAESGLHAFARLPEREHQLLLDIANGPDCDLTIAHTPEGEIVGQVTIAPLDEWWEGVENAYEVAIEISDHWRRVGLARQLLAFALEVEALEDIFLVALGLSWHWDLEAMGLSVYHYRQLIARLFASQGFQEYDTTEPEVSMEFGNILLVRIGKNINPHVADRFRQYIIHQPQAVKR